MQFKNINGIPKVFDTENKCWIDAERKDILRTLERIGIHADESIKTTTLVDVFQYCMTNEGYYPKTVVQTVLDMEEANAK